MKNKPLILASILIFLISFLTRIIYIESIPANINPDAADTLQTYIQFKYSGAFSLFSFNWNGAPAFNTYLIGFFWELFNKSILGLRFASVLFGSLLVVSSFVLFYALTKKIILSFLLSLSLSSNPWLLNFSRDAWENVFNGLFLNLILVGLLMYFNGKKYVIGIILMIVGSALGFYGYHPGKFFIMAVLFSIFVGAFASRKWGQNLLSIFIIAGIFLIITSPQIVSAIKHKEEAFDRINNVSVLNKKSLLEEINKNIWNNFKGFILFDNTVFARNSALNIRYLPLDRSPINISLIPFYLVGLIMAARRLPYFTFTFLIILFPVEILSTGTPDAARGIHAISLMYVFILLGINYCLRLGKNKLQYYFLNTLIILIVISTSIVGLHDYFNWVNKETTLNARRPAVKTSDYALWLSTLEDQIKQGGQGFNVGTWESMVTYTRNNLGQPAVLPAHVIKNR